MGMIDIIILACFVPAAIFGLKNGLVKQLVALGVMVLGLYLSVKLSAPIGQWICNRWHLEPFWVKVVSFAAIFTAVAIVLSLLGKLIEKILKIILLEWLNKLLGMVVAMVTTVLIVGTMIYLVNSANDLLHFIPEDRIAESRFYTPLLEFVQKVFPYLKSLF